MGIFSKKEDNRYVNEFDSALTNINALAKQFRDIHFESLKMFDKNFKRQKIESDLEKERLLFESHLDVLQKLKFQSDLLLDEAFKIVRNETALTETDRQELRRIFQQKDKTSISVKDKDK